MRQCRNASQAWKWLKFKMHVIDVRMRRYSARASVIEISNYLVCEELLEVKGGFRLKEQCGKEACIQEAF